MPTDAVFLLGESREHPMHVGGLQLYEPPPDAGPGFVRDFYDQLVAQQEFQPTFLKRPATFLGAIAPWAGPMTKTSTSITTCAARRCRLRGGFATCSS